VEESEDEEKIEEQTPGANIPLGSKEPIITKVLKLSEESEYKKKERQDER